jgi:hypothetical protein
MVDDEKANQTAKHLNQDKENTQKTKNHWFWNSRVTVLVVLGLFL